MKIRLSFLFSFIAFLSFSQSAPSYYNGIDFSKTGNALKNDLATLITNTQTTEIAYGSGTNNVLTVSDADPDVSGNILLIYGSSNLNDINQRSRIATGSWNKEHVYPRSLGTPNLNYSGPGADIHHLRPSDNTLNGNRGNLLFDDGSGAAAYKTARGGWFPGNEWRGDVARMIMYMYVRYNTRAQAVNVCLGPSTYSSDFPDILLKWNIEDPVSNFEIQRNNYVANIQGNRNPFIDNPYLATIIWGGPAAENKWPSSIGSSDTEAPTQPTNLVTTNTTTSSISLSWTASTDNVSVTGYDVYVNGTLKTTVTGTTAVISGLTPSTAYNFYVIAKDAANNKSASSNTVQGTTLADTTVPTTPTNLTSSNINTTSATVSWSASTDDVGVKGYNIYVDGVLFGTSTTTSINITGLTSSTTYAITVEAYDAAGNKSNISNPISLTTSSVTPPPTGSSNELYFSEYVEGTSNNKALEITNPTSSAINLTGYSISKQVNGAGNWTTGYALSGTIDAKSTLILKNSASAFSCTFTAISVNGAPLDFNGNDPVALFKNGVLIDVIGTFNNTANFSVDETLRRKVIGPSTLYNAADWEVFPTNTCNDLGIVNPSSILAVKESITSENITIYPNPVKNNILYVSGKDLEKINRVEIYNVSGGLVQVIQKPFINKNHITLKNIPKGVYLLKVGNSISKFIVE